MFAARTFRAAAPMATRAFSSTSRASIAKMTIVGRTGTVPEAVHISNDRTIVRYVIGSPYGKPPNERMSWFRVASFPTSEKHRDYLMNIPKGSLVCVEADARMNVYTDANSQKKADLSLVSTSTTILSRGRTDNGYPNDAGLIQEEGSHEEGSA